MSTNRKFRRAQKASPQQPTKPARDKEQLRRQRSEQRFALPGSERLWPALLGWDEQRTNRAWLLDAIHDAARSSEQGSLDVQAILGQLRARAPAAAERLQAGDVERAAAAWLASGDAYQPETPAGKWSELAALSEQLGLGNVSPHALQNDWETWTNLALAAQPRQELLAALAHTERAALTLFEATKSDNTQALATLLRLSWVALAYGDADAFARLRRHSAEWLKGELPGAAERG